MKDVAGGGLVGAMLSESTSYAISLECVVIYNAPTAVLVQLMKATLERLSEFEVWRLSVIRPVLARESWATPNSPIGRSDRW